VRAVNTLRKNAGLALDDRINLRYQAEGELAASFVQFAEYIQQETLAVSLEAGPVQPTAHQEETDIDGQMVRIGIDVA
jgi:isoleucyl-tRNA synthetase